MGVTTINSKKYGRLCADVVPVREALNPGVHFFDVDSLRGFDARRRHR
jgi:hypothetical protein